MRLTAQERAAGGGAKCEFVCFGKSRVCCWSMRACRATCRHSIAQRSEFATLSGNVTDIVARDLKLARRARGGFPLNPTTSLIGILAWRSSIETTAHRSRESSDIHPLNAPAWNCVM